MGEFEGRQTRRQDFIDKAKRLGAQMIILRIRKLSEQDLQILRVIEREANDLEISSCPNPNNQAKDDNNKEECAIISKGNDDLKTPDNRHSALQCKDMAKRDNGKENGETEPHIPPQQQLPPIIANRKMPLGIDINALANYKGRLCRYEAQWIAEGEIICLMTETADWFEPIASLLVDDDDDSKMINDRQYYAKLTAPGARLKEWRRIQLNKSLYGFGSAPGGTYVGENNVDGSGYYTNKAKRVPNVLRDKTDEQLIQELVEFAQTMQTDFSGGLRVTVRDIFWREKQAIDPEVSRALPREWKLYMNNICKEAELRLEATQGAKEVKDMPELVKEYSTWFVKNNCARHTRAYVEMFLAQKGIKLSRAGISMLYAQSWQKVKKSKTR